MRKRHGGAKLRAHKMRLGSHRSACAGKFAYPDEAGALEAVDQTRRRPGFVDRPGKRFTHYRCTACGLWHAGNAPAEGRRTA
jgi:hypothetical protein